MKTEQLLSHLIQDLKPVKRITVGWILASGSALLAVYACALAFSAFPPRADLGGIFWSRFHGLFFLPAALALFALWLGSRETASAAGRKPFGWPILWVALLAYGAFCFWYSLRISSLPALAWSAADLKCMALIGLTSLPVWILAAVASAFVLPISRRYEFAAAFAAGSVGALVVNLHCPYDGHGHHFLGHAIFPTLLGLLTFVPLAMGCRWVGKKLVELRAKSSLRRPGSLLGK